MKRRSAPLISLPTQFNGCNFRSRLEARWSIFFNELGFRWEYEPEWFDLGNDVRYLPDFRIAYPKARGGWLWFEVKPNLSGISGADWQKLREFVKIRDLIILDGIPACRTYIPMAWFVNPKQPYPMSLEDAEYSHSRKGVFLWDEETKLPKLRHGGYSPSAFGASGKKVFTAAHSAQYAWFGKLESQT